jgi:hypothetical protein
MAMQVFVRAVANGPADAPDEVGQAESDEEPGGPVGPLALDVLEPLDADAEGDADETEHDGGHHVAQAADQGDGDGLAQRPAAGAGHGDERQVVIGADDGVDEADGDGGDEQRVGNRHIAMNLS